MEQLQNLFRWYVNLLTDPKTRATAWTFTLATLTFTITFIIKPSRQFILNQLGFKKKKVAEKATSIPQIVIKIDEDSHFQPISDREFNSKIILARQIFRSQKTKGLTVNVIPSFSIKKLDDFHKRALDIKLKDLSNEMEKKVEILLSRPIEMSLENPDNLLTVLNSLLERQNPVVTGKTKIELYRNHVPKIDFPIWLSDIEMQQLAIENNTTVDKLKQELRIPTFLTPSIFTEKILHQQVIPALIREIYRIQSQYNFDITTPYWENILLYEVGLG